MIFITAAVFLFGCTQDSPQLLLSNAEDGEVYATYPLGEGDSFAVEFIHSVNKSPVRDVYTIHDGAIWNEECIYYGFGAGVETELGEGETLSYGEHGEMVISGIHKPMDDMVLVVGTVSDHTLYLGEETISLRDLCGRNSKVLFQYKEG
ncbi:MAG: DUF1850 domain-containing protein [Ruminiclostridium sp.]|jgi:hypothetical protein|nr:DUF1850 domain-containing protein [Ruminiclostridium sp.]